MAGTAASRAGSRRSVKRLEREERTLAAMVAMYCRDHHGAARALAGVVAAGPSAPSSAFGVASSDAALRAGSPAAGSASGADTLCSDCAALMDYARARLERCPYGADKPTCANCPTHCHNPAMRERVRIVMRHSGPRMLKEHPLMAAAHLIDGRHRSPGRRPG